jgi:multidrug efflux pump subunit AcrA (membrane-fusion protein)
MFADGIVEGANQELSLRFEVPGCINAVYVREGDAVKAGDVLAELETDAAELQLAESQIRLTIAMAERDQLVGETMRRTRDVAREPRADVSKPQLSREQQAIADGRTELAQTAVRRDQLLLDKCRLRAPNDGVVLRATPQSGELTGPNDERELFTIVSHGAMRVRAIIEELDGSSL